MKEVVFSVDFEDWYQGIELPPERWGSYEDRIGVGAGRLLDLLAKHRVRATFFVLGAVAERHPEWIARIAEAGHEIGTHGHHHRHVGKLSQLEFANELRRSIAAIRSITGRDPIGHRAPYFSITGACSWAFSVLADHGIRYDASIFPGHNWRNGNTVAPDVPFVIEGSDLVEFPVSTGVFLGRNIGLGGAYFRVAPLAVTVRCLRQRLDAGKHSSFYVHPWELDFTQPLRRFRAKVMATHYFGLFLTRPRLDALLQRFRFVAFEDSLNALSSETLPRTAVA